MIQSGGIFIHELPIFGNILLSVTKKGTDIATNLGKKFLDKQIDKFSKECITDLGITLTSKEVNDIKKVVNSLEIDLE